MTQQNDQQVVQATVSRRVQNSQELLVRMGITVEAYERIALHALLMNPTLAECSHDSIDRALIEALNAGLIPDGHQAAIVPYRDKNGAPQATLIPMIEGRLMLARRAAPGVTLRVRVVFHDDEWTYEEGLHPRVRHIPSATGKHDAQSVIAAYAIAKMPSSTEQEYEVMSRGDLDRYRGYSRARNGGPWETHYVEMCKKTVLGQLLKRLPKGLNDPPDHNPELAAAYELGPGEDLTAIVAVEAHQLGTGSEPAEAPAAPPRRQRRQQVPPEERAIPATTTQPPADPPAATEQQDPPAGKTGQAAFDAGESPF